MACSGITGITSEEPRDRWGKVIARRNANQRAYNARHKERTSEARRLRRQNDPEYRNRKRAIDKAYLERLDEDTKRDRRLRRKYGVTVEQFNAMREAQGGKCAICEQAPAGSGKSGTLHVDHDHQTRAVRGLLCDSCNRGLGLLGDSAAVLMRAHDYLRRHRGPE